jgi:excisionase family DNA binding protein
MLKSMNESTCPLLTNEVALLLRISPATVRVWERMGKLRALKTAGGVRLFERRDVEELAREHAARRALSAPSAEEA